MNITLEIRPETEAALRRQAKISGRGLEAFASGLLEDALHLPSPENPAGDESLEQVFAEVRGLLTDDEIDALFARNRSISRTVDFG
jgi:hypothetical protein